MDSGEAQSEERNLIDSVVGKLEEILVDPDFEVNLPKDKLILKGHLHSFALV